VCKHKCCSNNACTYHGLTCCGGCVRNNNKHIYTHDPNFKIKTLCKQTDDKIDKLCENVDQIITNIAGYSNDLKLFDSDVYITELKTLFPSIDDVATNLSKSLGKSVIDSVIATIEKSIKNININTHLQSYLDSQIKNTSEQSDDVQNPLPWWNYQTDPLSDFEKVIYHKEGTKNINHNCDNYSTTYHIGITNLGSVLIKYSQVCSNNNRQNVVDNANRNFQNIIEKNIFISSHMYKFVQNIFDLHCESFHNRFMNNNDSDNIDTRNLSNILSGAMEIFRNTNTLTLQKDLFELHKLNNDLKIKIKMNENQLKCVLSAISTTSKQNYDEIMQIQQTEITDILKKDEEIEKESKKRINDADIHEQHTKNFLNTEQEKYKNEKELLAKRSKNIAEREKIADNIYEKLSNASNILSEDSDQEYISKEIKDLLIQSYDLMPRVTKPLPKILKHTDDPLPSELTGDYPPSELTDDPLPSELFDE
jgi:hypothetical protein